MEYQEILRGALTQQTGRDRPRGARSGFWDPCSIALLLLAASTGASTAHAEGFRLERYPAPSMPEDLLWLERAAPAPHELSGFGRLSVTWSDDPLIVADDGGGGDVIGEQLGFHLSSGVSFLERFHAALALPVWAQWGGGLQAGGESFDPSHGAVGDPALDVRATLLGAEAPIELAVAATLRAPLGQSEELAADDGASFASRVLASRAFGEDGSFAGASLGVGYRPKASFGDLRLGSDLRWAAGGQYAVTERVGVTAEIGGSVVLRGVDADHAPIEGTVGLRYAFPFGATVGLGAGAGLSPGYGAPDGRATVSVAYRPPEATPVNGPP